MVAVPQGLGRATPLAPPLAPGVPPRWLQVLFSGPEPPNQDANLLLARAAPVHKLNGRHPYPLELLAALQCPP